MKKLNVLSTLIMIAFIAIFTSCEKDTQTDLDAKGEMVLSFDLKEITKPVQESNKANKFVEIVTSVVVSIEDASGNLVYDTKKIELYNMNGSYISAPISLLTGNYKLVKFLVMDDTNNALYATPVEGSAKAYLVNDPLPIDILINKDEVTKTVPEVLSTKESTPEDFGYATFGFNVVETFDFLVGVFVYNEISENFELTNANITITNDGVTLYTGALSAITNKITLRDDVDNCTIKVTKSFYKTYQKVFAVSDLKKYFSSTEEGPLEIVLEKSELTLQPGSEGIDAYVWSSRPDQNISETTKFYSMAWTWSALGLSDGVIRSFIKFDLSGIPENTIIKEAKLSFFYIPDHNESIEGHSSLSGSNESVLERVTSAWQENTITWNNQPTATNENSVILPQSTTYNQDYLDLDVTDLVKLMASDQANNNGFMLKLSTEKYYRCLLFASSDHPNAELHPKLVIKIE